MIFLNSFFGADELTFSPAPTDFGIVTSTKVKNGIFDDVFVTNDVETELIGDIPDEWDFDTVVKADYDINTNSGNVSFTFDNVTQLVVKRRKQQDTRWITLYVRDIDPTGDLASQLNIAGQDSTAGYNDYVYAIVPLFNGSEGVYNYAKTLDPDDPTIIYDYTPVKNSELVILDCENLYHTPITNGSITTTSNTATSPLTTLHEKYPTIIRNGAYNYETIDVSITFAPQGENDCDLIFNDPVRMNLFNRELKNWLNNENAKILKDENGNMWLVYIESGLSDSPYEENLSELRELSFTCDEIGDVEDEEQLWNAGLIDESVTEEYWNII